MFYDHLLQEMKFARTVSENKPIIARLVYSTVIAIVLDDHVERYV
jgi:hypothetical protein